MERVIGTWKKDREIGAVDEKEYGRVTDLGDHM